MSDNQIFIKSKKLSNMSAVMAFISRTTKLKDISQFISCNFSLTMWWAEGDGEHILKLTRRFSVLNGFKALS